MNESELENAEKMLAELKLANASVGEMIATLTARHELTLRTISSLNMQIINARIEFDRRK